MRCSADFAFATAFSWTEMLERLRGVGEWHELGDTLLSLRTDQQRLEKLTISWDVEAERWILDVDFEVDGHDAADHWALFAWRILDTLAVVDAAAIEKLTACSTEGSAAWRAFDHQMGFLPSLVARRLQHFPACNLASVSAR